MEKPGELTSRQIEADGEMRTQLKVLYGSVDELSIAVSGKE